MGEVMNIYFTENLELHFPENQIDGRDSTIIVLFSMLLNILFFILFNHGKVFHAFPII